MKITRTILLFSVGLAGACTYLGQRFPLTLSYANSTVIFFQNENYATATPTVSGEIDSCNISPALPAGLTIGQTTCAITGAPTVTSALTTYTVTAQNAAASASATITLRVSSATAIKVYCQPDFVSNGVNYGGISASSCNSPRGISVNASGLYAIDCNNTRGLFFPGMSTTATRVYGQGGSFIANAVNNGGLSADSLSNFPQVIFTDSSGVYISDYYNYRVLFYPNNSTTATRVYGQGVSFGTAILNNGGVSANSIGGSMGIVTDSSGVYIVDRGNNRVFYYLGTSTTASRVYGQGGSFSSGLINNGGITADSLNAPSGIAIDSTGVYISDQNNNRILFFPGTSTTATRVYGQNGSFTSGVVNNGGISAKSLNSPSYMLLANNGLYVNDTVNARVLFYPGTSTTAIRVYGQSGSFTSNTINLGGVTANSLYSGLGLATDGTYLYVADQDNNRILVY